MKKSDFGLIGDDSFDWNILIDGWSDCYVRNVF